MTNRVLLDSSGLKVSKPGVNVITANRNQLLFGSDASCMTLHMSGVWALSNTTATQTLLLGKTFSRIPYVTLFVDFGGSFNVGGQFIGFVQYTYRPDGVTSNTVTVHALTDRLEAVTNTGYAFNIYYAVWDFTL